MKPALVSTAFWAATEWRFDEDWEKPLSEVRARYGVIPYENVRL